MGTCARGVINCYAEGEQRGVFGQMTIETIARIDSVFVTWSKHHNNKVGVHRILLTVEVILNMNIDWKKFIKTSRSRAQDLAESEKHVRLKIREQMGQKGKAIS